ncbi:MAG: Unknown protein [uncultured Sulfurovum sp.]|uniref:FMN-binding domain-containing protein n=1 Tax=uncultured Sulfurovum sp. TaxID=269237 RepID=A0A6S6S859_9BACT|nr:MAG: Unknown protein [uncultured Sulfurovum sp.]
MTQKITLIFALFITTLFAQENISIDELLKTNYDDSTITIEKKSLILTKEDVETIQKLANTKVGSKIVRYYRVTKNEELLGNAILLKQKIRTKNAAILYMVDANNSMKGLEIVSFKEPSEYKPNDEWTKVFEGKTGEDMLIAGKDIPTISGATLSARAIADTARVALAIVEQKL